MTNRIAIGLGLCILALFLADRLFLHMDLHILAGRRLLDLTEYLAFWR